MPYSDQRLEQIFQQLGMREGGYLSQPRTSGGYISRPQSTGGFLTGMEPTLEPEILKRRDDNFFTQFGKGVTSPVMDTLSGLGITDPREMPSSVGGMIGNILGSMAGWTALTVLTMGVGTKIGLGAKAVGTAVKVGKGATFAQKAIPMATKGALWGGFGQAHTWAFGQQEYDAIPKQFLQGALIGGAFGTVAAGAGHYLSRAGKLAPKPETVLGNWMERNVAKMVTIDDPATFRAGVAASTGREGMLVKSILKQTSLDAASRTKVKAVAGVARANKNVSKTMANIMDDMASAKTLGEFDVQRVRLNNHLNYVKSKLLKDVEPKFGQRAGFNDAGFEVQKRITDIEAIAQEATWISDSFVTNVMKGNLEVHMPSLARVQDPVLAKKALDSIKNSAEGKNGLSEYVVYTNEMEDLLAEVHRATKIRPIPDSKNFRDASFLPEAFRARWTELAKQVGPDDLTLVHTGATSVTINSPIKSGDINKYFKDLKKLPLDTPGLSVQEAYLLRSPVGWLTTKLAPLRSIMGESQFRKVRRASIDHHKYSDEWLKKVNKIAKDLGYDSHKKRQLNGKMIGDIVERNLKATAPVNKIYDTGGKTVTDAVIKGPQFMARNEDKVARVLAAQAKIPAEKARGVVKAVSTIRENKELMGTLEKIAGRLGVEPDDLLGTIAKDHIHNAKLAQALSAQGNKLRLEGLAKEFGVSPDVLVGAAKGRKLFDDLFLEAGLDPAMYRAAYLPHFRKNEGQSWKVIMKEFQDVGVRKKQIEKIFWANELSRSGTATYDGNFFNAAERYIIGMSKKKHFEPVFKNVNETYKHLKPHDSRVQVYENLKQTIQGVPVEMDRAFDSAFHNFAFFLGKDATPQTSRMIGSMLAELQYAAGMGFNPFMPIRNLTQKALALSSITDSGKPQEALKWMYKFKAAKANKSPEAARIIRLNDILEHRVYLEGLDMQPRGMMRAAQMFGSSDATVARMDDLMQKKAMSMFRWSDRSNVEDVFGARMMYLLDKGAPISEAVELARATTMATQFMYGIDSPMLYKTALGKQIGIFQSWPLNWATMLWEQGTQGSMNRAISTVVTMAVASELLSMTGISFRSIHPTETVRGILPYAMLEGENSWPLALRVTTSGLDYMRGLVEGEEEAYNVALNNFMRSAEGLVPFGVVTNRTLKFIDRARHDWTDYADTGFLHIGAALSEPRQDTSRLVRMLEDPEQQATGLGGRFDETFGTTPGMREAISGWFGTTTKSVQRQEDWKWVSHIEHSYRRTRAMTIQAFLDGDYSKFQRLQEQLALNFGRWIEPKDIEQELKLMGMTARERQMQGLPAVLKEPLLQSLGDPYPQR